MKSAECNFAVQVSDKYRGWGQSRRAIMTVKVISHRTRCNQSVVAITIRALNSNHARTTNMHVLNYDFIRSWAMFRKLLLIELRNNLGIEEIANINACLSAYLSCIFKRPTQIYYGRSIDTKDGDLVKPILLYSHDTCKSEINLLMKIVGCSTDLELSNFDKALQTLYEVDFDDFKDTETRIWCCAETVGFIESIRDSEH